MKKYVYSEAKQVVVGVLISLFRFCPPFVHKNIFLLVGGHFSKSLQHLYSDSLFTINARETGIYLSSYISMELTFRPTHAIDNKVTINF